MRRTRPLKGARDGHVPFRCHAEKRDECTVWNEPDGRLQREASDFVDSRAIGCTARAPRWWARRWARRWGRVWVRCKTRTTKLPGGSLMDSANRGTLRPVPHPACNRGTTGDGQGWKDRRWSSHCDVQSGPLTVPRRERRVVQKGRLAATAPPPRPALTPPNELSRHCGPPVHHMYIGLHAFFRRQPPLYICMLARLVPIRGVGTPYIHMYILSRWHILS